MTSTDVGLSFDDILLYPGEGVIDSRSRVDLSIELGKWTLPTPFISSPMETVTDMKMALAMRKAGGLGVMHRFMSTTISRIAVDTMFKADLHPIAQAIGYGDHNRLWLEHADIFVLDVAHAFSRKVLPWVEAIKKNRPDVYLIAGSVATREGALALRDAGADALRVGIGSGAACTTRLVTGFGVPMVTSIEECAEAGIPIIADGGIKNSGDAVKAIAVGATAVMMGRLFAGCDEAPLKGSYFGQASEKSAAHNGNHVEGAYGSVEDTGPVRDVIASLSDGLRSGVSYGGFSRVRDMIGDVGYVTVSPLSVLESGTRI